MAEKKTGQGRILMIAAENDAIEGAKVGGIGDVVRDVPPVLAGKGFQVDVVCPSYGFLVSEKTAPLDTGFADFAGSSKPIKRMGKH